MEKLHEEFKQIILNSLDKTNKSKPKNLEIALQELNKNFSDIKEFKAYKAGTDFIKIKFHNQDIAYVVGIFSIESGQYQFLNHKSEILFPEDNDLEFIENSFQNIR